MNATHHLRTIETLFNRSRYPVATATFMVELGISKPTLQRLFKRLRDDFDWEIIYHRECEGGYTKAKGESVLDIQLDLRF